MGILVAFKVLSINLRIKLYTTIILSVVLYGIKLGLSQYGKNELRVYLNRILTRIFGPMRNKET
jgi:hypothetical protein